MLAACVRPAPSATTTAGAATGDAGSVVEVAAQPCARPTRQLGAGVVVADDVVATAAHTVDGDLRALTVDGTAAVVVTADARTDVALLRAPGLGPPLALAPAADAVGAATVATPAAAHPVDVVRTGRLVVHDTTAAARYERSVHTFRPAVAAGTSGAPLLDGDGRVLGIVVLAAADREVAYAVTSSELAGLLADVPAAPSGTSLPDRPACAG